MLILGYLIFRLRPLQGRLVSYAIETDSGILRSTMENVFWEWLRLIKTNTLLWCTSDVSESFLSRQSRVRVTSASS